jgi:hypothetical protein
MSGFGDAGLGGGGMASLLGTGLGVPGQDMSPPMPPPEDPNAKMVSRDRPTPPEARRKLVDRWAQDVRDAKTHWRNPFDRMRWNMDFVNGDQWQDRPLGARRRRRARSESERTRRDDRYVANIALRHVLQRTAELYPNNPTVTAKRRQKIMAQTWDGTQAAIEQAQRTMLQSMQIGMPPPPEAMQTLAEVQQVKQYDQMMERVGKTLELFYNYNIDEQVHSFKSMMKMTIRRAVVTGVGYVKLGFQRAMQMSPEIEARIADMSERLANIERLSADFADQEFHDTDAEAEQLRISIQSLTQEGALIVREGLAFDYPDSAAIIPDTKCRSLRGFLGCDWVAQEYLLYPDQVQEVYGVDIGAAGYTAYSEDGFSSETTDRNYAAGGDTRGRDANPACVWEIYSRRDGSTFVVCDGYPDFLQEPGKPDPWLERFWPWFSIVLNEGYDDRAPYPQSDIDLLRDMQLELNRARQGLREHRRANRPKTAVAAGVLEEPGQGQAPQPPGQRASGAERPGTGTEDRRRAPAGEDAAH